MRGPVGTVTQRKGGATWRDIGRPFCKVSRAGAQKPMNMVKPSEVIQKANHPLSSTKDRARPIDFIDPEAAGSQMVINADFVFLAYPKNVRWRDTKGLINFYTSLNAQCLCWEETCCLNWGHK